MIKPPSEPDMRGVRLEQMIRKSLADAWAQGVTDKAAESKAVQEVRDQFPDILESDIVSAIKTVRQ